MKRFLRDIAGFPARHMSQNAPDCFVASVRFLTALTNRDRSRNKP
jgi:hypothetical protein